MSAMLNGFFIATRRTDLEDRLEDECRHGFAGDDNRL
jgi:hypothetical protein